jgi:hypothetical protein
VHAERAAPARSGRPAANLVKILPLHCILMVYTPKTVNMPLNFINKNNDLEFII